MPEKSRDLQDARRIGERLRLYRHLNNLTQVEAASRIGVTKEHVSILERGHCYPSLEMLSKAAEVYGTGLANFFLFPPSSDPSCEGDHSLTKIHENLRLVTTCGVWVMDFNTGNETWSGDLCRLLGCPPRTQPSLAKFLETIHLEDKSGVMRFYMKVQARSRPKPLYCRAIRKDESIRRLLLQADQLEDQSDPQNMARLTILDVTDWTLFSAHLGRDLDRLEAIVEERTKDLLQSEKEAREELKRRIAAEQAAEKHRQHLDRILSMVPAMVYSYTPAEGRTECYSPQADKIIGVSMQDLKNNLLAWHDAIHPEDRLAMDTHLKMTRKGRPLDLEYRVKGRDGQWQWLHDRATPFRDDTGQTYVAGVVVNVTERKRIEEELHQSRKMFQDVAEDIPALICRYAPGCIITYVNEAYCRCFGKTCTEMEGTSFLDLMPEADQVAFLAAIDKLTPENPTVRTEHQVLDLNGEIRWHRWIDRAIFDARGRAVAYQSIGEDITEQKKIQKALRASEERYRSIYTKSPIAIELYDTSGRLVEVNPACLEMFGVQDVRELQGFDLFADPNLSAADIELLKQGKTACFETDFDFEKVRRHDLYRTGKTGTIWVRVLITPLGETGAHGYLAQIQDITERKMARQHLLDQGSRLVNILKGTNVGTWEWNVQTGETVFNERWAEIIGYDLEELVPISISTWAGLAHPEDLRVSDALLRRHFRGESDFYECEVRMRHKEGHWVWVLDRGRVITWTQDGKPLWMFGTHQDITQRKLAEAEKS